MDKKKLMELAERYQHKADTAFQNYQETGITRYDTANGDAMLTIDDLRPVKEKV